MLRIGVDVGGTFTDLVAWDGRDLHVIKIPSTPPEFHLAVAESVRRIAESHQRASIVHGSTVATNALLQRRVEPIAFVTTDGFRDMLLIGRQNRPRLYALRVERPRAITAAENWFTVRERIDARGAIVEPLAGSEIDRLIEQIKSRGIQNVAVCLLFSFINPIHERMIGKRCEQAGFTVTLSSEILPEFREYERASTTAISAALRPTVENYLTKLEAGLPESPASGEQRSMDLRIMHSGGGTLRAGDAAKHAARLVLSGPAGGVIGASYVARQAGIENIISYDMGGTSTDVATVLSGRPVWTTSTTIDGLPIALPMFEIHTVGAGGGSIASLDTGGALRVGPQSAGAVPGPACYARGGTRATVTDANIVLGRIVPKHFLDGTMHLDIDAAHRAVDELARQMGKSRVEAALGIVKIVEANMAHAVRAVTSRRGRDPRQFALVSFGGAGGLHACGLAEILDIPRVLVPPYAGVLSALGMLVAPSVVDVSQTVLGVQPELDDSQLVSKIEELRVSSRSELSDDETESIEYLADARFAGQSHELTVSFGDPTRHAIEQSFLLAYRTIYGQIPAGRSVQIVSLRLRRSGWQGNLKLPAIKDRPDSYERSINLIDSAGRSCPSQALFRHNLLHNPSTVGPLLLIDAEATCYLPAGWGAAVRSDGSIILQRQP